MVDFRKNRYRVRPQTPMWSEADIRKAVQILTNAGITQQALADAMGMNKSRLSRWVTQSRDVGDLTITELQGFFRYLATVTDTVTKLNETLRVAGFQRPPTESPPAAGARPVRRKRAS